MTLGGVLKIAWHRKAWIAAPTVITAGIAALIGWGLGESVTYRASVLVTVTEGAQAEAVFALTSPEVAERVVERWELRVGLSGRQLLDSVGVTVIGRNRLRLDVEARSKDRAERLAEAIVREAAATVSAFAKRASEPDVKRREDLEYKELDIDAAIRTARGDLSELRTGHEFVTGPQGDLVSASRGRMARARELVAARRRELAGTDAEIEALRERLSAMLDPVEGPGGAASEKGPLDGVRERLAAVDRELARLRENLTDAHPRVATLLAERALLEAGSAVAGASGRDPLRAELERDLRAKENERLRAASVISALERDVQRLDTYVRTEAAAAEAKARDLGLRIATNEAELARVRRLIGEAKDEAERNRASRAALGALDDEEVRAYPTGDRPSPPGFAAAGAVLGLMLGGLLAALAESLDPVIRSGEDVVRHLELPVLATVSCPAGVGRERAGHSRWTGAALWLGAFLVVAAVMVLLVYPGWERIRTILWRGGTEAPAARGGAG